jgi:hypothetical protein
MSQEDSLRGGEGASAAKGELHHKQRRLVAFRDRRLDGNDDGRTPICDPFKHLLTGRKFKSSASQVSPKYMAASLDLDNRDTAASSKARSSGGVIPKWNPYFT